MGKDAGLLATLEELESWIRHFHFRFELVREGSHWGKSQLRLRFPTVSTVQAAFCLLVNIRCSWTQKPGYCSTGLFRGKAPQPLPLSLPPSSLEISPRGLCPFSQCPILTQLMLRTHSAKQHTVIISLKSHTNPINSIIYPYFTVEGTRAWIS